MDKDVRKKYQRYLRLERGLSENTLEAYMLDLDKLLTFLHDKGVAPESASLHDLEEFCGALFDLGAELCSTLVSPLVLRQEYYRA